MMYERCTYTTIVQHPGRPPPRPAPVAEAEHVRYAEPPGGSNSVKGQGNSPAGWGWRMVVVVAHLNHLHPVVLVHGAA